MIQGVRRARRACWRGLWLGVSTLRMRHRPVRPGGCVWASVWLGGLRLLAALRDRLATKA
jgi:hypothetical protein